MAYYKAVLQYDGSCFSGFQTQNKPGLITVQDELQKTLGKIFNQPVKVIAAGRTDAGVHALRQTISFSANNYISSHNLQRALNGLLHRGISVSSVVEVSSDFHARFSAKSRTYIYALDNSSYPSALLADRAYWYPSKLNIEAMRKAAQYLKGEHDFKRFAKGLKDIKSTIRCLQEVEIITYDQIPPAFSPSAFVKKPSGLKYIDELFFSSKNMIYFYYKGLSFIHSMVRIMTGTLIHIGRGRGEPELIQALLNIEEDCRNPAENIPGRGLYLVDVEY